MKLEDVRRETMTALGITDLKEVDYITQELLDEYASKSKAVTKTGGTTPDECRAAGVQPLVGFGAYGNSLVFAAGVVHYKQGPRGTPNYGCGTDAWDWRNDPGDTFTPQADCSGGRKQYLLYCPTCL